MSGNLMSYSLHLSNDRNKSAKARQIASTNKSGTTSYNNNAIQNVKGLGKADHHNLRKYDNEQEKIRIIKGTNNLVNDTKKLYKELFDNAKIEYNNKQTRNDRKIDDYFKKISDDTKHDLACEIIIEIGDMNYWKDIPLEKQYKMVNVFNKQINDLERIVPNFKVANATAHFDESSPHLHIIGVPYKDNCKTGMKRQVGKSDVFTRESLMIIQDKMRECCIKEFNEEFELKAVLKEKSKGRNFDIPSSEMGKYQKKKDEITKDIENKTITKDKLIIEVDKLESEKSKLNKQINKKKITNTKVLLSDKGKLRDENFSLKEENLKLESQNKYLRKRLDEIKERDNYIEDMLNKYEDKLPQIVKDANRLLISGHLSLDHFKSAYDEDYKKNMFSNNKKTYKSSRKSKKYEYEQALKRLNKEGEESAEKFYEMFDEDEKDNGLSL